MLKTKIEVAIKAWYLEMWRQNPEESAEIVASGCPWGDGSCGEWECDISSNGSIMHFAEFFTFCSKSVITWMENKHCTVAGV